MIMGLFAPIIFYLLFINGVKSVTYDLDDSSGMGRRFDGIGGISGGGATSKLLVNYPEQYRNQILDYLFKPEFGASLQILKVEIGGDAQSTDGTEASHMHNPRDENYNRGYEWWVMKEAKKRNPNIKLYGLPWGFPGWLAGRPNDPYVNRQNLAMYITKWVEGAKIYHNLTIDLIGIWNEHAYDVEYIKLLRQVLDKNGFQHVQIVAADGDFAIAEDVLKDKDLADAIVAIGVHYPGTQSTPTALQTGKTLWASEDCNAPNDDVGGGCWARILNQNYVNGKMTSTIAWNLVTSYYDHIEYDRSGLMTAMQPWSGNYMVQSPIWASAHTTQFTDIGWTYLKHGQGVGHLESGGSYVALASPDMKDLTIVVETMSHNHSVCFRPPIKPYDVQKATITLKLKGSFSKIKRLQVWYTKLSFTPSEESVLFKQLDSVLVEDDGTVSLYLGVDEIWTLTTLSRGHKGDYPTPPSSEPFPLPYKDDFEGYEEHEEPYNLAPQLGSFEVVAEANNKFLRQTVIQQPLPWCFTFFEHNHNKTLAVIGDYNWGNTSVSVDARLSPENGTRGILLAAWVETAGCHAGDINGTFFYVFPEDNFYILSRDFDRMEVISTGPFYHKTRPGWNTYKLILWWRFAYGYVNGQQVMQTLVAMNPSTGFVGIGTDSWGLADFDNLEITTGLP